MGCYTVEPAASLLQERFDKADFDSEILDPIHNENRANALLIAAAPDLLEALQGLLTHAPQPKKKIRDEFHYILYREAARKAIAKAEGRR